jgi:hypothetical protein
MGDQNDKMERVEIDGKSEDEQLWRSSRAVGQR